VATRMFDRRPAAGVSEVEDRAGAMLARHGELLMRVARQYSLCADDAQDAVQRALEIYMRRASSLEPATELAWLKVVVKHEALAVRRGRAGVAGEEVDLDAVPAAAQRSVEERLESAERVARSAEIMRRLKRDEARALMLKAEGLSYVEIGERLGWT
jgi:RNA polymerase sigma factor (sigma-70 family)